MPAEIPVPSSDSRLRAAAFAGSFLAGATMLAYEIAWARLAALAFGSTPAAVAATLAAVMAGIALGSLAFGALADRRANPLRLFGWLQIAGGLAALAVPALLAVCGDWFRSMLTPDDFARPRLGGIEFGLSAAALLVPCILLGGKLPVLVKSLAGRIQSIGRSAGGLYGANTLGAVAGCAATGGCLLGAWGLATTVAVAVALDIAVGIAFLAGSRMRVRQAERPATEVSGEAPPRFPKWSTESERTSGARSHLHSQDVAVLLALGLSGFCALVYEIAWFRLFALVLGSSTQALTVMLATFLAGLGLGSLLFSRWADTRRSPTFWLGLLQCVVAVGAVGGIFLYAALPAALALLSDAAGGQYPVFVALQGLLCAAVMIVPALAMGAAFPAAGRALVRRASVAGGRIGLLSFCNTAGALAGPPAATFLLIPILGIQETVAAAAFLSLLSGLFLLAISSAGFPAKLAAGAVGGLLFFLLWDQAPDWNAALMTTGPYVNRAQGEAEGSELLFYREGIGAVITVRRDATGMLTYQANGKNEGRAFGVRPQETLAAMGHIPMLWRPHPNRCLLIGLGSGITLGAMARYDAQTLDVVEIEPAVAEAARFFAEANGHVLDDPRVRLFFADGRAFLAASRGGYDVIVSAVSDPWVCGSSHLFTREYFELLKSRLAPGGLAVVWFQNYRIEDADLKTGLRTFQSVFPHAEAWFEFRSPADLILMGADQDLAIPLEQLQARTDPPAVRADLARIDVREPLETLAWFLAGENGLRAYAGPGGVLTDDRNRLEFQLPRLLGRAPMAGVESRIRGLLDCAGRELPVRAPSDPEAARAFFARLKEIDAGFEFRKGRVRGP